MDSLNEQQRDGGFERLAQDARVDARMRSDTKPYTEQQREALLRELCNYRVRHGSRGSTLPWSSVANRVGIKPSTLTELRKGRYRGDVDAQFRKIDELLSDESKRASSDGELSGFASIGLTEEIFGVLNFGVVHRTMPVVVGEPGSGKTEHARAFAATREKGVYVRIDEGNGDARGVTELLCEAIPGLRRAAELTFRQRLKALREYLRSSLNTVVVVDEAQKLEADGLEVLRDLHDSSDPAGRRNVPVCLFGDPSFYRLIGHARNGRRSPIKAQMVRRMYPVYNIEQQADETRGGAPSYSAEDIISIVRAGKLRVVTPAAANWLTRLANLFGYGRLGMALAVFRTAHQLARPKPVDVPHLQEAFGMVHVSDEVREAIDAAANGELLRTVSQSQVG